MKTSNYSSKMSVLSDKLKSNENRFQTLKQRLRGSWKDERYQEFEKKYIYKLADTLQTTDQNLRSFENRIRQIENKLSK
jgi:uncharacterized protein YukE